MACNNVCRLCDNLIISLAVNYDATTNQVVVNIPAQSYKNNCKYCIVIAQTIPTASTINAQVVVTVDGFPTRYPLVNCDCSPVNVCAIRTRTKYSTIVKTDSASAVFKLLGKVNACNTEVLPSIPSPDEI